MTVRGMKIINYFGESNYMITIYILGKGEILCCKSGKQSIGLIEEVLV